ncbi:PREDICTED: biorientation of chromosomes in cell division protein 1 [Aptenodytes forsteri]|uniref:biorientation of chromosomes in cell division protein 1 n=1 Tax=Aptenodytes forsteri TaxID=9233 RepID=UPI0004F4A22C|nr:PREDICTED: biorientation of chromosomes in cell division protein 1 [Aptenodytes forsteri]
MSATPCWRELVTSSGEKGLLAAVGQECDSMDTSECLDESWGFYTQLGDSQDRLVLVTRCPAGGTAFPLQQESARVSPQNTTVARDAFVSPAYQNLRQKVDNFVSTHLDKQEWNPAMNKNQLRNGLRQSVIQSGMLEAGVDRIISQVVDPKLNHIFRPQIERAIHEFLAAQKKEESVPAPPPEPENKDPPAPSQDAS